MALKKFKMKKNLKAAVEREENSGGNDSRFIPYYKMKTDEKMKVLIIPDANGEPWTSYSLHSPNLKLRGLEVIRCPYKAGAGDCPVCSKGFDLLDEGEKDEAKRWFAKDYNLCSVIVIDTPIDIPSSEDGNQIKLFNMPYAVMEKIKEAIKEGQVDEDTLSTTPFVIKKTESKGGQASYAHSYFDFTDRLDEDEVMGMFDDDEVVEQFDYENLDIIKEIPEFEDLEEWLEKAEKKDAEKKASGGEEKSRGKTKSLKDRMRKGRNNDVDENPEEEEIDDTSPDEYMEDESDSQEEEEKPKRGSLRDRLKNRRR